MSEATDSNVMDTYGRLPVQFESGEGVYLLDTKGKRYLDALTGLAVCGLGHAHPRVTDALREQAGKLLHTSNLYVIGEQERLATRLCAHSGMERVFFGNSGAEANEAAIKIARLHGHNRGIAKPRTIVMEASFHGRTMATLTATGNRKVQAGFEPLLGGFVRAPYGDIEALRAIADNDDGEVVAVFFEPVLGEGGIIIPPTEFLGQVRQLADDAGWLMLLDEIQTGNGRTGAYFAYQHAGILPDVVTTAKGLGNGMPIGVCLAQGVAASTLKRGNHGSTFGGNPIACAAANAVIDEIEESGLLERATELGDRMSDALREGLKGDNRVQEVRNLGLMMAIEMRDDCSDLVGKALDAGLLINVTQGNIIRLLPPLVLSDSEAQELVERLLGVIRT